MQGCERHCTIEQGCCGTRCKCNIMYEGKGGSKPQSRLEAEFHSFGVLINTVGRPRPATYMQHKQVCRHALHMYSKRGT